MTNIYHMKSVRFLLPYLIFAVFLCFGLNVQAQIYDVRPDRPIIELVSVDPVTGDVTIKWNMPPPQTPPSPTPNKFVLHWYKTEPSTTNHFFATVPASAREYTFNYDTLTNRYPMMPDPRKTSVPFTVSAVQDALPDDVSSLRSYENYNVQVNSKYDSCRSEIKLNWYHYKGWQTNTPPYKPLISYHVMRIPEGGGPHEEIKILSDQDTFYIVPRVNDNERYTFYIAAKRSDGTMSTSYYTERFTKMPRPPDYITALGTEYNSDGLAEVSFILDPAAETFSYEFFGSSRHEYSFVSLGAFTIHGDTTLADIQKRERTFYYKLEAWHVCRNKYTATSNLATALWLTLKQESTENLLFWDPYWEWNDVQNQKIDAQYDIYRKIGDNPEEVIATVADPATTAYRDDLSGILIDGDICYWIIAKPLSYNLLEELAISNSVCIKPESDIWIPQAFTPNVAGIDSEFKPFFSYPPQEYMFIAYDRIGAKVFETKDINSGWDGRLMNGKPASEGVYMYYLKYRTAMGRLIEKRGTFSLLLP